MNIVESVRIKGPNMDFANIKMLDLKDQYIVDDSFSTSYDWCLCVPAETLARWNKIQDEYNKMQTEIFTLSTAVRI